MLQKLYSRLIDYAQNPQAKKVLTVVAFAESSIFPIPPDPLYIAMILANRAAAWSLATICTISSVVGGIVGYYIGFAIYETLGNWIINFYGLEQSFVKLQASFEKWGFWIVALKGLSPFPPYKVITIFSGFTKLDLSVFILASTLARGFRFYTLACLLKYCGKRVKSFIEHNLGLITIIILAVIILSFYLLRYF